MFGTFTAIILLIVFLVPGYVWRTIEGQFVYLDHRLAWEKFALGLLTRSSLLYLPFTWLIYQGWKEKWYDSHPIPSTLTAIGFVVFLPAVVGLITGVARQKEWVDRIFSWKWIVWILSKTNLKTFSSHRVPTAWEAVFSSKLVQCWVVVTRKNGDQIHGRLGPGSHLSIDPEDRDLFISQTLYWDETTQKYDVVPGTLGVYINADEIATIELIKYSETEDQSHAEGN